MEMFSETGKSLVLHCFCPACAHTFTHTLPQKDGFGCPALSKDVFSVELAAYVRKI